MNADRERRLCLLDNFQTVLHIAHLLVGIICLVQTIVIRSGHHDTNPVFPEIALKLQGNCQIDVLFECIVHADLAGVNTAMSRVHHYGDLLTIFMKCSSCMFFQRTHKLRRFPCHHNHCQHQQNCQDFCRDISIFRIHSFSPHQ